MGKLVQLLTIQMGPMARRPTGKNKHKKVQTAAKNKSEEVMDASKRRLEKQDFPLWPRMRSVGAPATLATLCMALCTGGYLPTQEIDMVEYFAGQRAVTRAFLKAGLCAVPFEIEDDSRFCNMLSPEGVANALLLMLKVRDGGCSLAAPVCSSWVMISMATSGRTAARPLGYEDNERVAAANRMVSRV